MYGCRGEIMGKISVVAVFLNPEKNNTNEKLPRRFFMRKSAVTKILPTI
jgi:hypothetical protein